MRHELTRCLDLVQAALPLVPLVDPPRLPRPAASIPRSRWLGSPPPVSPRAVADVVMANPPSYRGVEAIPTMKTKKRIKHDPPARLWQRHGAGERVRPRFRAAGNHVVRRATRRKMSKTMRINEEGHGNGGYVPRRLMKGDDHPQWRGRAAAKRERGQGRSCRSAGDGDDGRRN